MEKSDEDNKEADNKKTTLNGRQTLVKVIKFITLNLWNSYHNLPPVYNRQIASSMIQVKY